MCIRDSCWAHARRAFADAVKAADKKNPLSVKTSVAYQALQKIAEFYRIDTELKELPATDRLTPVSYTHLYDCGLIPSIDLQKAFDITEKLFEEFN